MPDRKEVLCKSHVQNRHFLWNVINLEFESPDRSHAVSLETPVGESGEDSLGDMVEDRTEATPEEAMEQLVQKEEVSELLESLSDRERQVIRLRYGLDGGKPGTLEEIGEQLGVTRERVRQIEARALEKLRMNAEK